ncbi:MAG: hypothetical protein C0622_12815 [Desulfuromonas sp.]|nr:MAG: hypothetical protein C0622_12815 [Desulfuromonas sp.]
MRSVFFTITFLFIFVSSAFSQNNSAPSRIVQGFEEYEKNGAKAAIIAWTKGSAIEGSKESVSQANTFNQLEEFLGKYIGYELVKNIQISPSTSAVLIIVKYEKGNLFSTFHCYKLENGEIILNNFDFNTKVDLIWPRAITYGYFDNTSCKDSGQSSPN